MTQKVHKRNTLRQSNPSLRAISFHRTFFLINDRNVFQPLHEYKTLFRSLSFSRVIGTSASNSVGSGSEPGNSRDFSWFSQSH